MDTSRLTKYLSSQISSLRFEHVRRVQGLAQRLARKYDLNQHVVSSAVLLHDLSKEWTGKKQLYWMKQDRVSKEDILVPAVWHGIAAAIFAERRLRVQNQEVLSAVRYHTTGRCGMSLVEKVVFISDFCEPGRRGKDHYVIFRDAFINLDSVLGKILRLKLEYLIGKNMVIHSRTLDAWNQYGAGRVD